MKKINFFSLSTHIILLSFLLAIFLGSLLLCLPISSATGTPIPYIDALFTATSATCVTGLVTVTTVSSWSIFGQAVILVLIQIGGLGIITVMAGFVVALNKKLSLSGNHLLKDAFNVNSMSEMVLFLRRVISGSLLVEAFGALLYMTVFVPDFGARGIWISLFNSVSAFCNAGIDIIAENSLVRYVDNPMINFTTCTLIILGGIGYIVWWDIIRVLRSIRRAGLNALRTLTLHSKIVLSTTAILIFAGAALIFALEYNNPDTIGELSPANKLMVSFFQSITTRTAGFATIPQEELTSASAIVCLVLMFIGGSPVGTAGGVKTATIAVIAATAMANIRNRSEVSVFHRNIPRQIIGKSTAVVGMSFAIMFVSALLLCISSPGADALDLVYEAVSATATVGLSRNITGTLQLFGKIVIIITMYLGRIGPISLAIAFNIRSRSTNIIKNPTENISVG